MERDPKLVERYGKSEAGNFYVVGRIGVPHPYMIGAKHVVHAADHFGGMLGTAAIESCERHGICCEICKGDLAFADHKQALLIECLEHVTVGEPDPETDKVQTNPELHAYLLRIMPMAEEDKYEGFSFLDGRKARGE